MFFTKPLPTVTGLLGLWQQGQFSKDFGIQVFVGWEEETFRPERVVVHSIKSRVHPPYIMFWNSLTTLLRHLLCQNLGQKLRPSMCKVLDLALGMTPDEGLACKIGRGR